MLIKKTISFFDKLEDKVRAFLSRWPILYSFIGGVGIVLFWKGIWETAEDYPVLYGPTSALLGLVILLATGLLVSFFIGDSIILSGIKHEKKLVEKTENEVRTEEDAMQHVIRRLEAIEQKLNTLTK